MTTNGASQTSWAAWAGKRYAVVRLSRDDANREAPSAMRYPTHLIPTTIVGSYPRRTGRSTALCLKTGVPRVHAHEIWRVAEPYLAAAQDERPDRRRRYRALRQAHRRLDPARPRSKSVG